MIVENNVPLQPYNSFGIVARAQNLARIASEADVAELRADPAGAMRRASCWAAAATSCSPATSSRWC